MDIFAQMFSGMGGFADMFGGAGRGGQKRSPKRPGSDLRYDLDITLEEVEKNGKIRVLSTSARDVVEEYLTVNQHLSREVEGRLVVEA